MTTKQKDSITTLHQWVTIYLLPICFGLLIYIAKGVYETGQINAKDIVKEAQRNNDQDKRLDYHDIRFTSVESRISTISAK